MAQLRVVDASPYKIVESFEPKEEDVAQKGSAPHASKRSGRASLQPAQALVRKLTESAEKRWRSPCRWTDLVYKSLPWLLYGILLQG